ncbi:ATP synthase F1 subunit gamma [Haloimpatiens sp. FM7315]|uniref:ATP synthase F1 subunit gamma n=1 Tax=Haloimpatiens sp. FM7315 TaxID=3298609 RepID=UPI0035A2E9DE
MAGAGLISIKRRIKSITNTRKITRAMNVVATSKLRKCRNKLDLHSTYYNSLLEIMSKVVSSEENNIYVAGNKSEAKLYIVLTSDSGLCGGFNGEAVSTTVSEIQTDKNNNFLIIVGQKGRASLRRYGLETVAEYVDIPDVPTSKEATILCSDILKMFNEGKVGEVNIIYHKFISTIKREITVKTILPLGNELKSDEINAVDKFYFEPSANSIFEGTLKSYLTQTILNCMINSKCSEQSSRSEAMSSATSNANDLLDKLTLKYNRIRQSIITQEISEIVGGAEAQK